MNHSHNSSKPRYACGLSGTTINFRRSRYWYSVAAHRGDLDSMVNYAIILDVGGNGIEKDHAEANIWYRLAANQGNALSMYHLGSNILDGLGVAQDAEVGRRWLSASANGGCELAIARLREQGFTMEQGEEQGRKVPMLEPMTPPTKTSTPCAPGPQGGASMPGAGTENQHAITGVKRKHGSPLQTTTSSHSADTREQRSRGL